MIKLFSHPVAIIGYTIFCLIFFISLQATSQKTKTSSESLEVLDQEISRITQDVTHLQQQVAVAKSPTAQEKIIRNELLMQKPGEFVVQLPPIEDDVPVEPPKPTPAPLESWRQLLFTTFWESDRRIVIIVNSLWLGYLYVRIYYV